MKWIIIYQRKVGYSLVHQGSIDTARLLMSGAIIVKRITGSQEQAIEEFNKLEI